MKKMNMLLPLSLLSVLAVLPGCGDKCGHCSSCSKGEAVVSFGKKIVVDSHDFDKTIQAVVASNPMLQQFLPVLPKQDLENLLKQIAQGVAYEHAMKQWIDDQGISSKPEYQTRREELHRALDRDLATREFREMLAKEIAIGDEEIKNHYGEKKETQSQFQQPPFLMQAGGVQTEVVHAKSMQEAENLKKKLAGVANLKKFAQEQKLHYEDLGLVAPSTMSVDEQVKKMLFELKKFPTVGVVKISDKLYFVFVARKKQEAKYAEFEKLEERAKNYIKQIIQAEKTEKLFQERMEELKAKYAIVIDDVAIAKKIQEMRPEQAAQPASEVKEEQPAADQAQVEAVEEESSEAEA